MSDYVDNFQGAVKDSTQAVIKGEYWDTEYSKIVTATASKVDKVPASSGKLVEINGSEAAISSGVDAANLTGLTSSLQTQINGKKMPVVASPWVPGYNFRLLNGTTSRAAYSLALWPADTQYSIGPTSSFADNEWAALDDLPIEAAIAYVGIELGATNSGSDMALLEIHHHQDGGGFIDYMVAAFALKHDTGTSKRIVNTFIPLDGSNFLNISHNQEGSVASVTKKIHLKGYLEPA